MLKYCLKFITLSQLIFIKENKNLLKRFLTGKIGANIEIVSRGSKFYGLLYFVVIVYMHPNGVSTSSIFIINSFSSSVVGV